MKPSFLMFSTGMEIVKLLTTDMFALDKTYLSIISSVGKDISTLYPAGADTMA